MHKRLLIILLFLSAAACASTQVARKPPEAPEAAAAEARIGQCMRETGFTGMECQEVVDLSGAP